MFYTYYKQWGDAILIRYKKSNGETVSKTFKDYKPSLFTPSTEHTDKRSIYNQPLKKVSFDSIRDAKAFVKDYSSSYGMEIHGNQNFGNQFIIDVLDGKEVKYIPSDVKSMYIDIEVSAPEMPSAMNAVYPITAITAIDSKTEKYHVFFLKNGDSSWSKSKSELAYINDIDIEFKDYDDERDLLTDFITFFRTSNVDITTGWNSSGFDMPYIVMRSKSLVGDKFTNTLSPFNRIMVNEKLDDFKNTTLVVDILGVPDIDYLKLYKKHIFKPRIDYKLDTIAEVELGHKKLSYEESGSLYKLYDENTQKYVDYNIQDTKLVFDLNKKLGLIDLTFTLAYYTTSNYADTLGTVKQWENLLAKFLYRKGVVPPPRKKSESKEFEGAYVRPPIVGKHSSLISVDLNSLYPHIKQQLNLGQETYVPYSQLPKEVYTALVKPNYSFDDLMDRSVDTSVLKKYNLSMSPSFAFYTKDKMSVVSEINREIYKSRKVHKNKMLDAERELEVVDESDTKRIKELEQIVSIENNLQMALKILLNSGYGAIGNSSYLYYLVENAEAITSMGKYVNQWTMSNLEKYLQKVLKTDQKLWVYGDTDSGYIQLHPLIESLGLNWKDHKDKCVKILDKFVKEIIDPKIEELSNSICDYLNNYEQRMFWEREVIAESCINVSKKKYVMKVWNSEGVAYKNAYYKKIGLESVKSSTPPWAKGMLEHIYELAIDGSEQDVVQYVKQCKKEFNKLPINKIAIPTGVNGIETYYDPITLYKKGAQAHVKAAINHNFLLTHLGIRHIPAIVSGSKILFVYLNKQNPYKFETLGFEGGLPPEFSMDKYVDRKTIYEKGFISPLEIFLAALKWDHEEKIVLDL